MDGDFSNVRASNLYNVPVPQDLVGHKYLKLFDFFTTRRHMIPLGLYRTDKIDLVQINQQSQKEDPEAGSKKSKKKEE